jgi:hypothetical protein
LKITLSPYPDPPEMIIENWGMAITWAIRSLTEPTEYAEKNQKTL